MVTKMEPCAWGYNRAALFLGDINTGTWPSMLGESRIWGSKMWSWGPRNSDLRTTALARTSSTDPSSRQGGCYIRTITASVQLENKITGRESQRARHQDEPIGGKPPVWLWLCSSCYCIPLRSQYSHQHPVLKSSIHVLRLEGEIMLQNKENYIFLCFNPYVTRWQSGKTKDSELVKTSLRLRH
jgi:hypothetical protein